MGKQVAVLGGGVGGLSAAQELAERGFQVDVYERRTSFGGKARSISVPNSAAPGRRPLPGEHGFRFFPSFYKHLPDTMKRIPFAGKPNGVFDNLIHARQVQVARAGRATIIEPTHLPQTLDEWTTVFRSFFGNLGLANEELLYFADRLLVLVSTCPERRLAEYENIAWWDFVGAAQRSVNYQRYLGQGLTRSLVAMRAEVSSLRTVGYIMLQLLYGMASFGGGFDRLLNGPTNDAWIDPWVAHLQALGVNLHGGAPTTAIQMDGARVKSAVIQQDGQPAEITADYYVSALPVEIISALVTDDVKNAAPSLANINKLETDWMNGIQFYLAQDVPLVNGHTNYLDSPWALTSVSQRQFWSGIDFRSLGDGRLGGILSVDISNWETSGILYGKTAMQCTSEEIKNEVWAQLKAHLNFDGAPQIEDANLLSWFLDPDIQRPNPSTVTNLEPLLINTVGSLQYRPEAHTEIDNLFLAADYVRTYTDLATMEAANEAARRATNAILSASGSNATPAGLWPFQEPEVFKPLQDYDQVRFKLGLPHGRT